MTNPSVTAAGLGLGAVELQRRLETRWVRVVDGRRLELVAPEDLSGGKARQHMG